MEPAKPRISTFNHFAVIVEGEVVSYIAFPPEDELNTAAYSSNPVFIQVPYDNRPDLGSKWDGSKFTEPQ